MFRVIAIRCTTPITNPTANPIPENKFPPIFRSNHHPASPGSTISSDTAMIREDHSNAVETAFIERSDGGRREGSAPWDIQKIAGIPSLSPRDDGYGS
jgi:hypothetical protein